LIKDFLFNLTIKTASNNRVNQTPRKAGVLIQYCGGAGCPDRKNATIEDPMNQKLISTINEIRENISLFTWDEASIKSGVVLRLLSDLKWNPFDVNEVKPEYTVESGRVDFSLRVNGSNKVFIEVKRLNENLEPHQEQLLNYSFREGVKLAVLTNGFTWWFYLPLHEGSWEQRRFYTADFVEQDTNSIAERFIELLAKPHIASGEAIASAENLHEMERTVTISRQTIPKAWHKIITDPDDLLVELLIETTEKLSGFRPKIDDIEKFLKNIGALPEPESESKPFKQAGKLVPTPISRSSTQTALSAVYINKVIRSFTLLGKTYRPRSWKELLVTVAEEIYRRHASDFDRSLSLRGSRMSYFSMRGNELSQPAQIAESKYFVETKLNSNSIVRRSRELMALFGYKEGDLTIVAE
jgi:predicted type IV restriction endonuclease